MKLILVTVVCGLGLHVSAAETSANPAAVKSVNEDGMLGYVQPVGAAPGKSGADKTEVYGVGAFLAAGSEVYKLTSDE